MRLAEARAAAAAANARCDPHTLTAPTTLQCTVEGQRSWQVASRACIDPCWRKCSRSQQRHLQVATVGHHAWETGNSVLKSHRALLALRCKQQSVVYDGAGVTVLPSQFSFASFWFCLCCPATFSPSSPSSPPFSGSDFHLLRSPPRPCEPAQHVTLPQIRM
jgi:hypothetical protein